MSLYNMMNGVSPATFVVLPMLGKHPDEYPRFRDCFLGDENHPEYDEHILVYTRTGGGNRESYKGENEAMRCMETFVADYDDGFDSTYAMWVFSIPEKWKADFALIKEGRLREVSEEYQKQLNKVFPKLKEKWEAVFAAEGEFEEVESEG